MECYICSQNNWHELPELNKERLLQVCKDCGNIAYLVEPGDEAKVLEYYRKEYRPAPTIANLLTSQHKLMYVRLFLDEFLKGKQGLICGDVGSAIGYIPNALRKLGHKAYGCELTLTYRRFCEHFYGIPLTEELDESKRYDLITIYHVLEHLIEPDKKLAKYASLLKDDGRIMVACPEWLDNLEEASGSKITSFQHLFHKDHINVFTAQSVKNLFAKCGLEVEKENHTTYGQTYILKKAAIKSASVNENWEEVVAKIMKQNEAIALYQQRKYLEATELWPKFPDAWLSLVYETHLKVPEMQQQIFDKALAVLPENVRIRIGLATWLYQRERFEDCIKECDWIMDNRPNEDILIYMGWCFAALRKYRDMMNCMARAADINPQKWSEAMNWVCKGASEMLAWDEVAQETIKEELLKREQPKIKMVDPYKEANHTSPPVMEVVKP